MAARGLSLPHSRQALSVGLPVHSRRTAGAPWQGAGLCPHQAVRSSCRRPQRTAAQGGGSPAEPSRSASTATDASHMQRAHDARQRNARVAELMRTVLQRREQRGQRAAQDAGSGGAYKYQQQAAQQQQQQQEHAAPQQHAAQLQHHATLQQRRELHLQQQQQQRQYHQAQQQQQQQPQAYRQAEEDDDEDEEDEDGVHSDEDEDEDDEEYTDDEEEEDGDFEEGEGAAAAAEQQQAYAAAQQQQAAQQQATQQQQPAAPHPAAADAAARLAPAEQSGVTSPQAAVALAAYEAAIGRHRLVAVRFRLTFRAEWGQRLKVVGSHPSLGKWVLHQAPELKWSDGDVWQATLALPSGSVVEYKYVLLDQSGTQAMAWQQGNNSVLALRFEDQQVDVTDNWGGNPGARVQADGEQPVTRETRLMSWAGDLLAQLAWQTGEVRQARVEMKSAVEEARVARFEAQLLKSQLAALALEHEAELAEAEAERYEAMADLARELAQARTMNDALQAQLANTTDCMNQALEAANDMAAEMDGEGGGCGGATSHTAAAATTTAMPASPAVLPALELRTSADHAPSQPAGSVAGTAAEGAGSVAASGSGSSMPERGPRGFGLQQQQRRRERHHYHHHQHGAPQTPQREQSSSGSSDSGT